MQPSATLRSPRINQSRRPRPSTSNRSSVVTVQSEVWRSPVHKGPDRSPWHASRIAATLSAAVDPGATLEQQLRGANALFLCASESDENRASLRGLTALLDLVPHLFREGCSISASGSHSGARICEHVVNAVTVLLDDAAPNFNSAVAYDSVLMGEVLPTALQDRHSAVVLAAARFLRRLSEVQQPASVGRQVVLTDELFDALVMRHETCGNVGIRTHLLAAVVNVSADPSLQFLLARCQRLLRNLVDEIHEGEKWSIRGGPTTEKLLYTTIGPAKSPGGHGEGSAGGGDSSSMTTPRRALRPGLVDVSPLYRFTRRDAAQQRLVERSQRSTERRFYGPQPSPSALLDSNGGVGSPIPRSAERMPGGLGTSANAGELPPDAAPLLDLCELALRVFNNLLSSDENCAEVKRLVPEVTQAAMNCRGSVSPGVAEQAREVVRRLHDMDQPAIARELALEILEGRAASIRTLAPELDGSHDRAVSRRAVSEAVYPSFTPSPAAAEPIGGQADRSSSPSGRHADSRDDEAPIGAQPGSMFGSAADVIKHFLNALPAEQPQQ